MTPTSKWTSVCLCQQQFLIVGKCTLSSHMATSGIIRILKEDLLGLALLLPCMVGQADIRNLLNGKQLGCYIPRCQETVLLLLLTLAF
ncbi:unnamed protein product [Blepharisma stoltei]|uniref:Uncharacterized protein n=1 Tax=Blepharisma stoltei TaxID=1481888 RepID=A0AAU9JSF4_9CILI|nr:unnamed protein product [Blepharisma stoltei]